MEKARIVITGFTGAVTAVIAWMSARMGILLYILFILLAMMVIDYITGMTASKYEALDHPDNSEYGWNSKKGLKGIFKKFGYMCIIAVAMVVDYIVIKVASAAGLQLSIPTFFGILVSVWFVLNEALSIIENAGRMGTPIPEWLKKYIAVLKNKIEAAGENAESNK